MRAPSPAALAAGLTCLALGTAATAQVFSGAGPARPLILPRATPALSPDAEEKLAPPAHPALRRPQPGLSSLRLAGESGEIVWPLYVTEAEARSGGRFVVSHLSAVSVLPESSSLTLALNGSAIGVGPIDAASGVRVLSAEIAPGQLARGYNAIRLSAAQRHRVDCSVEATYELWTQIDPEGTGFVPAGPARPVADIADLPALAVAADGSMPIRLVQGEVRMGERQAERLIVAAQGLSLAARVAKPSVDFGPAADGAEGVSLAVGTAETLSAAFGLPMVDGPRLALIPAGGARRPTLVVTGRSEAEIDAALARLADLARMPATGSRSGLQALADSGGRAVSGGERISLADLGFSDAHVTGRLHRVAFDLALPHDFLPADYGKVVLDLAGGYAAGLASGAKILVDINGANAASAELGKSGGETFSRRSVFLPLRLMRPGVNRIVITAELPRADDAACASRRSGIEAERLTLLASTQITVPPLARIARQPDIGQTLSAGYPYAGGGRRPTLGVPSPDRPTMAAAATLAVKLALAAGRPIPFALIAGRTAFTGPTLVVSPARALDAPLLVAAGLDPQALKEAWSNRPEPAPAEQTHPYGRASAQRAALRRDGIAACRGPILPDAAPSGRPLSRDAPNLAAASAILAQAVTGPLPDDVLTLVTASDSAALDLAAGCLAHPRVWHRPEGRLATLDASGGARGVVSDSARFVTTQPLSPGNLRRIAAGWLSLHAGFYGLFALLLAACLAGSTHWLVGAVGRRSA